MRTAIAVVLVFLLFGGNVSAQEPAPAPAPAPAKPLKVYQGVTAVLAACPPDVLKKFALANAWFAKETKDMQLVVQGEVLGVGARVVYLQVRLTYAGIRYTFAITAMFAEDRFEELAKLKERKIQTSSIAPPRTLESGSLVTVQGKIGIRQFQMIPGSEGRHVYVTITQCEFVR